MKKLRLIAHLLIATLVCFITASLLQTQMVLAGLSNLDISITIADRFTMSIQDLVGLLPSYGSIILVGLTIGFAIAKLILRFSPMNSRIIYVVAGGVTMLIILIAMQPVLGVTLLAGARSVTGIMLQILAGMLGGMCFMQLRAVSHKDASNKDAA